MKGGTQTAKQYGGMTAVGVIGARQSFDNRDGYDGAAHLFRYGLNRIVILRNDLEVS